MPANLPPLDLSAMAEMSAKNTVNYLANNSSSLFLNEKQFSEVLDERIAMKPDPKNRSIPEPPRKTESAVPKESHEPPPAEPKHTTQVANTGDQPVEQSAHETKQDNGETLPSAKDQAQADNAESETAIQDGDAAANANNSEAMDSNQQDTADSETQESEDIDALLALAPSLNHGQERFAEGEAAEDKESGLADALETIVAEQLAVDEEVGEQGLTGDENNELGDEAVVVENGDGTEDVALQQSELVGQPIPTQDPSTEQSNPDGDLDVQRIADPGLSLNDQMQGAETMDPTAVTQAAATGAVTPGRESGQGNQVSADGELQADKSPLAKAMQAALKESGDGDGKASDQQQKEAEVTGQMKRMASKTVIEQALSPEQRNKIDIAAEEALHNRLLNQNQAAVQNVRPTISMAPLLHGVRVDANSLAPGSYVSNLQMPLQSPEWKEGLSQKLAWFVSEKIQSAKIHVNPPELGPVEMKIQITKDQAQIQVQSPHAVVRDLLEGTAHRLREMLASQGIELSGFDVGGHEQQANEGREGQEEGQDTDTGLLEARDHEGEQPVQEQTVALDQLVDYYI